MKFLVDELPCYPGDCPFSDDPIWKNGEYKYYCKISSGCGYLCKNVDECPYLKIVDSEE